MGVLCQTVSAIFICVLTIWTPAVTSIGNCRTPMDVAFLVDSSGSLGNRNYARLLNSVNKMATYFNVSLLGSHASVILYSEVVELSVDFNDFLSLEEFKKKVSNLPFMRRRTRIDLALDMANTKVFTEKGNVRNFVPKIAILFTDGKQTRARDQKDPPTVAKHLEEKGVAVYVVAIGNGVNRRELEKLVTSMDHYHSIRHFPDLLGKSEAIADKICKLFSEKTMNGCNHPVDLGFILHSDENLSDKKMIRIKQFISSVATIYGIDGIKSRAGLVLYSDNATVRAGFNQFKNLEQFNMVLTDLRGEPGKNRMDFALKEANQRLFTSHSSVSRIAILLTIGQQTRNTIGPVSLKNIAADLRARGIKLFVVALDPDVDIPTLEQMVQRPSHAVNVNLAKKLNSIVVPLTEQICRESVPTARQFTATAQSFSTIIASWRLPRDPEKLIIGYELTWKMIENDKEEHIINAAVQSSGILSANISNFGIKHLDAYSLYEIYLSPKWVDGVQGDVSEIRTRTLEDINECLLKPCDGNAQCTNTRRSYNCKCNIGYSGNGFTCYDDDECLKKPCDSNGKCTNTPGSFKCACQRGFSGDGFTCIDNDECTHNPCDTNAKCTNSQGSFTCQCNTGYSGDGFSCIDNDECLGSPCDADAQCTNTPGSFTCQCHIGYSGDGFSCIDNDECDETPCDVSAKCANTPGSFTCKCNTGFIGDGFTCNDVKECTESPCDVNAKCTNIFGSFECKCNIGYSGDGFSCTDDEECLSKPCDANGECTNTPGSFVCQCNTGYSGDGFVCVDNNECRDKPCDANAKCTNTPGSFRCQCNIGYSGDGFHCVDINECNLEEKPCDTNAKCFNTEGSYYCECDTGYNGNGRVCSVVNICSYPMDLALAMDASDSISIENFEIQKEAVIMLARSFGISRLGTHTSVIVYGSEASVEIKLSEYVTLEDFSNAVRKLEYTGGNTRIDQALAVADSVVFTPQNGGRGGMPKMFIIMTDGQQTSSPDAIPLAEAVSPLKSRGVKIATIAIGKEVDEYELMAISEAKENIFHIQSFDTLFDTITEVGQSLCQKAKKDCKSHADIAFLVDSSASMRGGNYLTEKSLIKAIGREFDVSIYGSHVGLVLYSNDAEVITAFNNKTTLKEFETTIDTLPLKGGKIRLDKALRLVASEVFTEEKGMRNTNVPKIMFILTDGTQNRKCDEEALELAIAPLRSADIHIVAIGVGEAEERELRPLVKSPSDLFTGGDFNEVTDKVLQFIKGLCKNNDRSCAIGSQFVDFNVGGCVNEKPVEVAVCDGKCSSGTRYITEAPYYESRCACCFPLIDASKDMYLKCQDGSTKLHRITEVVACECRSCGNSASAPPVKHRGENKDESTASRT